MQATRILMDEHRIIERVLDSLEAACNHLGAADAIGPAFFLDAVDFIRNFADRFHHMKEEDVLFEFLAANGMPKTGGPIAVMLHEHELGRRFTQNMRAAAEKWAGGDDGARADIVDNAQGYVDLLRQHIAKEDGILFTMAAQILSPEQDERIVQEYARVEKERAVAGTRAKYEALAAKLADAVRQATARG